MGIRRTPLVEGEYYHIYNRGVEKIKIFLEKEDYLHFLKLLYLCNSERSILLRDIGKSFERGKTIVNIGAYCLMPNHFHILIHEKTKNGISTFMKKLSTAYAMYFNNKYERSGVLFQGRFKTEHINNDRYFKYLYAYIHLNPIKLKKLKWRELKKLGLRHELEFAKDYHYSSLHEYINNKHKVVNPSSFPNYFPKIQDHLDDLLEWIFIRTP